MTRSGKALLLAAFLSSSLLVQPAAQSRDISWDSLRTNLLTAKLLSESLLLQLSDLKSDKVTLENWLDEWGQDLRMLSTAQLESQTSLTLLSSNLTGLSEHITSLEMSLNRANVIIYVGIPVSFALGLALGFVL